MGAKRTPDLIPLCHPILLSGVEVASPLDEIEYAVKILATVSCSGQTGVEMEALTAVSAAALTVYDMCKAVQRDMVIGPIRLLKRPAASRAILSERTEHDGVYGGGNHRQ